VEAARSNEASLQLKVSTLQTELELLHEITNNVHIEASAEEWKKREKELRLKFREMASQPWYKQPVPQAPCQPNTVERLYQEVLQDRRGLQIELNELKRRLQDEERRVKELERGRRQDEVSRPAWYEAPLVAPALKAAKSGRPMTADQAGRPGTAKSPGRPDSADRPSRSKTIKGTIMSPGLEEPLGGYCIPGLEEDMQRHKEAFVMLRDDLYNLDGGTVIKLKYVKRAKPVAPLQLTTVPESPPLPASTTPLSAQSSPLGGSVDRRAELITVFQNFDLDQSGTLEPSELLILGKRRRHLGQKRGLWTEAQNLALVRTMDRNHNGKVEEEEFAEHFMEALGLLDDEDFMKTMHQFLLCVPRTARLSQGPAEDELSLLRPHTAHAVIRRSRTSRSP